MTDLPSALASTPSVGAPRYILGQTALVIVWIPSTLLGSNIQLTQQDKELTERLEVLTREIHAHLTSA